MTYDYLALLTAAIFVVAWLYSSVGHAGASGYIAVMTLFGLGPSMIKPTALTLNILVASLSSIQFFRAGHFSFSLFWPFALLSVPCAFLGGYLNLPTHVFKVLVGIVLLLSAARLFVRPAAEEPCVVPSRPVALSVGAGLGLLSGLTGTGGGIFLTPLLLLKRWARVKSAAAVSACFILVNSIAALLGNLSTEKTLPTPAAPLALAALAGGALGSYLGSTRLSHAAIKRLLAVVLLIAGAKLVLFV
jgi:uncharacterized membrane protein YfcA